MSIEDEISKLKASMPGDHLSFEELYNAYIEAHGSDPVTQARAELRILVGITMCDISAPSRIRTRLFTEWATMCEIQGGIKLLEKVIKPLTAMRPLAVETIRSTLRNMEVQHLKRIEKLLLEYSEDLDKRDKKNSNPNPS